MRTYKLLWFEVWQGIPPKGRVFIFCAPRKNKFYMLHVTNSLRVTLAIVLILVYFLIVNLEPTTPNR